LRHFSSSREILKDVYNIGKGRNCFWFDLTCDVGFADLNGIKENRIRTQFPAKYYSTFVTNFDLSMLIFQLNIHWPLLK
jgi:hypothetical protein